MIRLYDILEKAKTMETVKRSVDVKGWGRGGVEMNRWSTGHFPGCETILYDNGMVNT